MEVLRTPETAFANLPGYPFTPRYVELGGSGSLRMHFVDEGAREHPVVLLLHGLPAWSYLYRHMVPILVEAGCRVVAPDLIGCGMSDQPSDPADHSYAAHVEWLTAFVVALDLREVTLLCEDIGAIFGLRLVVDLPGRIERVVALNPCLPTGGELPPAMARWLELSSLPASERPAASALVRQLSRTPLSEQAAAGYDAPFGDQGVPSTLGGLGAMLGEPALFAANQRVLGRLVEYLGPLVVALSEPEVAARAAAEVIVKSAPGARWLDGPAVAAGRRLIAEDRGPELAADVLDLIRGAAN